MPEASRDRSLGTFGNENTLDTMTYQDWLQLDDRQREEVHFTKWNVYERDGYKIAHMAASRLADSSPFKFFDIRIGTYHGGEYTLEPIVSDIDYQNCPPMLQQIFEGFRVIWHPLSRFYPNQFSQAE